VNLQTFVKSQYCTRCLLRVRSLPLRGARGLDVTRMGWTGCGWGGDVTRMENGRDVLALCNGAACMVHRSCYRLRPDLVCHHCCWRGHGFESGDDRSSKSIIIVHRSSTSISIGRRKQSASFMEISHRYVAGTERVLGNAHIHEDSSIELFGLQSAVRGSIARQAMQARRERSP
jgi:hypothetical protein